MLNNFKQRVSDFLHYQRNVTATAEAEVEAEPVERTNTLQIEAVVNEAKNVKITSADLEELFTARGINFKYGRGGKNLQFPDYNVRCLKSQTKNRYSFVYYDKKPIRVFCTLYYEEIYDTLLYYIYLKETFNDDWDLIGDCLKLSFNNSIKSSNATIPSMHKNKYRSKYPLLKFDSYTEIIRKFEKRVMDWEELSIAYAENQPRPDPAEILDNEIEICDSWTCLKWDNEGYLYCKGHKSRIRPSYLTTIQTIHSNRRDTMFGFTEAVMQQLEVYDKQFKDYHIIDFLCQHYDDPAFQDLADRGLAIASA